MTDGDKKDIALKVAELLKGQQCPHGIDAETASELRSFAMTWKASRKTVIKTVATWITVAFLGALVYGVYVKIKWFRP